MLDQIVPARRRISFDHHLSHAACALFSSPFGRSLIFSYDKGGNDGSFRVYLANKKEQILQQIGNPSLKLGRYQLFGWFMTELRRRVNATAANYVDLVDPSMRGGVWESAMSPFDMLRQAMPGKMMALAALGKVRSPWRYLIRHIFETGSFAVNEKGWRVASGFEEWTPSAVVHRREFFSESDGRHA